MVADRGPLVGSPTAAEAWRGYKRANFARLALAEGDQVLDVGCGTGEDARAIAGLARGVIHLADKAERARHAGVVSADEAAAWLDALAGAARTGRFFCALTVFTAYGRRP